MSAGLLCVILPVAATVAINDSHASDETIVMGAVAVAAAVSLLLVFIFQFCAAPVRQRNERMIDLARVQAELDAERCRARDAVSAQLALHKSNLRAALTQFGAELHRIELSLAKGDATWRGDGFGPFYGPQTMALPMVNLLAQQDETEELHNEMFEVYRLVDGLTRYAAERHGIRYAVAQGQNTWPDPPLDVFDELRNRVARAVPLCEAAKAWVRSDAS